MALRRNSNFSLYTINRLAFKTEAESVYCAVRSESLLTQTRLVLKGSTIYSVRPTSNVSIEGHHYCDISLIGWRWKACSRAFLHLLCCQSLANASKGICTLINSSPYVKQSPCYVAKNQNVNSQFPQIRLLSNGCYGNSTSSYGRRAIIMHDRLT